MRRTTNLVLKLRVLSDIHGQDLIEYALMAGFVALSAGAASPAVAGSISSILSQVHHALRDAEKGGVSG